MNAVNKIYKANVIGSEIIIFERPGYFCAVKFMQVFINAKRSHAPHKSRIKEPELVGIPVVICYKGFALIICEPQPVFVIGKISFK
jgi:hypothetical protein